MFIKKDHTPDFQNRAASVSTEKLGYWTVGKEGEIKVNTVND